MKYSLFHSILLRAPVQSLLKAYEFTEDIPSIIEEGIYLASSEFWEELKKRHLLSIKEKEKLTLAFQKYWIRSCTRATPYGTFAGSTLINLTQQKTDIRLKDNSYHKPKVRLDMNYVSELVQALSKIPEIYQQLTFFTNNSIYELSENYRYVEYLIESNLRKYQISSIHKSEEIKNIFKIAENGASVEALVEALVLDKESDKQEAREFIFSLYQSQLLVTDLEPSVTGMDPMDRLLETITKFKNIDKYISQINYINTLIKATTGKISEYQEIENALKGQEYSINVPKNTLQTDLYLELESGNIEETIVVQILNQILDIFALSSQNKNQDLERFKNNFIEKYEEEEIPLAIALDADIGIGYAGINDITSTTGALIDDLIIKQDVISETREFNSLHKYILNKYHNFLKNDDKRIDITNEELKRFSLLNKDFSFPNSMFLMGKLFKRNGKLDTENFEFEIASLAGPSAGSLFGRFTYGDKQILEFTKGMLEQEEMEMPDAIFAEVVHLPQARVGNILLRPNLRKYEIPYVGISGLEKSNQIQVSDLLVSIRNGKIVLRSKMHNKQVIPRLTTAHNFSHNSLPVYKFLCDLQYQGTARPIVWDWGIMDSTKYLPRVTYKNLILKKARWKFDETEIADMPKQKTEQKEYFERFRLKHDLPEKVLFVENDNNLLIDFTKEEGIAIFLHYLNRYKYVSVEEFLFTEENCIVRDKTGAPYTNEMIIPFFRENSNGFNSSKIIKYSDTLFVKRKFSPYSQWIYFKIYAGSAMAEKILRTSILEFIDDETQQQLFEKFYFVRYRDDNSHFRIRFYNHQPNMQAEVYIRFVKKMQPLLDKGAINKILLDTYSREIERYGENLIEETEIIFYHDSLAVLRFISLIDGEEGEKYRILFGLRGIDILLNDFSLTLFEKRELLKRVQSAFFNEFGSDPGLQKQLNSKYRAFQKSIFSHLDPLQDETNEIEEGVAIFKTRSEMNEPIVKAILTKLSVDNRQEELFYLLSSYIHMFMNRLFISNQRKYELVLYHFLEKYYTSQDAIFKKITV